MRFLLDKIESLSGKCEIYSITFENENCLYEKFIQEYLNTCHDELHEINNRIATIGKITGIKDWYFSNPAPGYIPKGEDCILHEEENSFLRLHTIKLASSLVILTGYLRKPHPTHQDVPGYVESKLSLIEQISISIKDALYDNTLTESNVGLKSKTQFIYEFK